MYRTRPTLMENEMEIITYNDHELGTIIIGNVMHFLGNPCSVGEANELGDYIRNLQTENKELKALIEEN